MTFPQLIFRFISTHKRQYIAAGFMLAAYTAIAAWIPMRIGHMVDEMVLRSLSHDMFLQQLGILLFLAIANYFLDYGWRTQLIIGSYQMGVYLRTELYKRLSLQGPDFFQKQTMGNLMAMGTNDADAIEHTAGNALMSGVSGILTLVVVLTMMFIDIDWRLTIIVIPSFIIVAISFKRILLQVHGAAHDQFSSFGQLNDQTQESLSGVRTIRALGLESYNTSQFAALAQQAADTSFRSHRLEAAFKPIVDLTLTSTGFLALTYGGYLVWQGEITIGLLSSFTIYLGMLIWPMFAAGSVVSLIEHGRAAWSRLEPVLSFPLSIEDTGTINEAPQGSIQFKDVYFNYPEQTQAALLGVSFTIEQGKTVGIVGPSGSGKSTLIRLLLRQYTPIQGKIVWGEHGLSEYELTSVRKNTGWVAQEPFLFSASIAESIALGKPDSTPDEIEHAAKLAAIHDDILRFPQGYETQIGERGVSLSGGQRQRVAIARALLLTKPLLLLDDSLSAIDTGTQASILQHLRSSRIGRSVVLVSHRLSSVADADLIIVMSHGKIIERGTHEQLLNHEGWYAAEWRHQQLEAALDEESLREDSDEK